MFTGIIEALGEIRSLNSGVLVLGLDRPLGPDPVSIGESIAVNGCCLTVVNLESGVSARELTFDLSPETVARTSFSQFAPGHHVNLERAMRADGRFGGHVVQGHVDTTGEVVSVTPAGNSTIIRFRVPEGSGRYLIDKGSISIDGISLTVVEPTEREFDTWIIPYTIVNTNLGERVPGDRVNLEFDAIARYVERLLQAGGSVGSV
ncbi:MAG TPA: riboflavin synthase [Fimbriimonadaceae bacterium]|nr:riboflavin synthase [Fimbriimonadaceae bacterium]